MNVKSFLNTFILSALEILLLLCAISYGLNVNNVCLFKEEGAPFSLDAITHIQFFIPHDWTNNEDNLNYLNIKLMSQNLVLRHPLSSTERPNEIKLPMSEMAIGWNKIYLNKRGNNVQVMSYTKEPEEPRKVILTVPLRGSNSDRQPFFVTGLYSLVNCLKVPRAKKIYYNIRANSKFRVPFILYKRANKFEAFSKISSFNFGAICSGERQKVCKNDVNSRDSFTIRKVCEYGTSSTFSRNVVNEVYVSSTAFDAKDNLSHNYTAYVDLVLENNGNRDFYIEMEVLHPSYAPISYLNVDTPPTPSTVTFIISTTTETATTTNFTSLVDPRFPLEKGCGMNPKKDTFTRIAGGATAHIKDWPWMVAFVKIIEGLVTSESHVCGGVLITQRLVLTSASCFYDITFDDIKARLGEYDFNTHVEANHVDFDIATVKIHERYDPESSNDYDIALVKLNSSAGESFPPACLPPSRMNWEDQFGYVTGWGKIYFGGADSNRQREAFVQIWKQSDCESAYLGQSSQVTDNMLCAGGRDQKGSCEGDTGGPLMVQITPETRWYVVGIDSWGLGCGIDNSPTVYTKVDKYLEWIQQNINI